MNFDISIFLDMKDKDYAPLGLVALEGRLVIRKAIAAGVELEGLVCVAEREAEWLAAADGRFPVLVLAHAEFSSIVGFPFHRGELAVGRRPVIEDVAETGNNDVGRRMLCLWDVTDPSNVGGLVRSAVALGADSVLFGPGTADPFYRKAIRASMGNVFSMRLWAMREEDVGTLHKAGIFTVAATLSDNAKPLNEFVGPREVDRPIALFVGNEGYGLPRDIAEACDAEVAIPMATGVDSLNVNVAAGILMYELFRKFEHI
jgi:tRNA G18 (ribose-2'-O)-methylase SpoU